ncbi:MAG: hypothetical protein DWQ47_08295 [Acidobacteria bacterium]|nr:MAG: hypothetical protein DWQ32_16395 [Acidobacteriota bacterium]REJ99090.1 MAG: hypothetical protein DWQ38_13585 [Acidobacteriota bacterium]REK16190.1 MAG: hypothetical protein DWQ43_04105 [Acidobacteriota bacterium]REK43871.1 MAG: hypothetical protein DWQ47_08295 [Acidobacteriota bacterium]
MLPQVIIIGTMKGGTSSLFKYLYSHPEMVGSRNKETDFFAEDDVYAKGKGWYESLFQGSGSIAFEASPKYTVCDQYPEAPERIKEMVPEVKLIYLLRDPISRTISHYGHNFINGREIRPFSRAIREHEAYISISKYFYQLQPYLEQFPRSNLLLLQSERLRDEQEETLDKVAEFIGIEPHFDEDILRQKFHVSKTKKKSSRLEFRLRPYFRLRYVYPIFKAVMAPLRTEYEKPVVTEDDMAFLKQEISPDIESLRNLTGMEFRGWKV